MKKPKEIIAYAVMFENELMHTGQYDIYTHRKYALKRAKGYVYPHRVQKIKIIFKPIT